MKFCSKFSRSVRRASLASTKEYHRFGRNGFEITRTKTKVSELFYLFSRERGGGGPRGVNPGSPDLIRCSHPEVVTPLSKIPNHTPTSPSRLGPRKKTILSFGQQTTNLVTRFKSNLSGVGASKGAVGCTHSDCCAVPTPFLPVLTDCFSAHIAH